MSPPAPAAAILAARALELVDADPREAARIGSEALSAARGDRDAAARSTALRALGLAAKRQGDLARALAFLRRAVATADRATLPAPAAEARMSLAHALLDKGSTVAALRQADRAATTLRGTPAARLLAQRGLILQRAGRLEEALTAFRRALPVLTRAGDGLWEARLRNNRGLLHAYAGRLKAAENDLRRAAALYTALGQPVAAAEATWNLGFVAARAGDLPGALARYVATEAVYRKTGLPAPELLYDRAELLLSAALPAEAVVAADAAAAVMAELGTRTNLAEVQLLAAKAALAQGDHARARELATAAADVFRRQQRTGWDLVARYVALRADDESGSVDRAGLRAGQQLSDRLATAGWVDLALDVRLITARAALALGQRQVATQELRAASAARRRGPVDVRVRAWYAEALLRREAGSGRGVTAALNAGMRALDGYRVGLGAADLRVHAAAHGQGLTELGLRLAVQDGRADRMLQWTERWRASNLRLPPVRPPRDNELADLLAELRRVSADLEVRLLDQRPGVAALRREQAGLEEAIRSRVRRHPAEPLVGLPAVPAKELSQRLRSRALVSFATVAGAVHAVVLADGRTSLHRAGDVAAAAADLGVLHFALRRLAGATAGSPSCRAAFTAAVAAAARLDRQLLAPLRARLGDRALVIVPTGRLPGLPWSLLPTVVGRAVSVAPSAWVWTRAHALPVAEPNGPGVLVCGPGLRAAEDEIAAMAQAHPRAVCLTGPAATVQAVSAALDGAHWAQVAAHGRLRTDNPLFSALELADGRLTVYDLELLQRAPRLVVLSACESGVEGTRVGEQNLGLASALLALGTRTLLATTLPVSDRATAALMLALHARLDRGQPVAQALADEQALTVDASTGTPRSQDDPAAFATAAAFACLGAG